MKKSFSPITLKQVSRELQVWRESKGRHRNKIPTDIKEKILELLKIHPREEVIRILRLSRPTVMRYLNHKKTQLPSKVKNEIPFIEFPPFHSMSNVSRSPEIIFEFPNGMKIRISP